MVAKASKKTGKSTRTAKKKPAKRAPKSNARPRLVTVDPTLFDPLSEGERADALRILTEDRRLVSMAKVARYRVIAVEPLVVKPPHPLFGMRAARIVAYDYASDRAVEAAVDLDAGLVAHLAMGGSQPMLAREEESAAIGIALADELVKRELELGDVPQAAMHYWSRRDTELSHNRRSAAVLFGRPGARPSIVAVVDLLGGHVIELVPSAHW